MSECQTNRGTMTSCSLRRLQGLAVARNVSALGLQRKRRRSRNLRTACQSANRIVAEQEDSQCQSFASTTSACPSMVTARGPDQSRENPLGAGGEELHNWMFETRTWHQMSGEEGGDEGWMTASLQQVRRVWARPSWAGICSGRSAGTGLTRSGRAGGATTPRTSAKYTYL